MAGIKFHRQLWDSVRFWRRAAMALATAALALAVAAMVSHPAPDFSELRVTTFLHDGSDRPLWAVRVASAADQIAVDNLAAPPPPPGKTYQLWVVMPGPAVAQPLGLLPLTGRKIFAEAPGNIRLIAAGAALWVTLEPASGELAGSPSSAPIFRTDLDSSG